MATQVRPGLCGSFLTRTWRCLFAEEFSIYLNYVRKLGFEETPDYDFLRELFAKVMKNNGDVDDQIYDWNLLNGREQFVHFLDEYHGN